MKKILLSLAALCLAGAMSAQTLLSEGFEQGIPSTWTTIDADADGQNWMSYPTGAYVGEGCAASASWTSNTGALNPDNWLITPAITIPSADFALNWYVAAQDPSYPQDKYSVYIATGNTVADFTATTPVHTEVIQSGDWTGHMVDLSDYAGQTIYVAFRHYDCSDLFVMKIDEVKVFHPLQNEVVLNNVVVNSFVEQNTAVQVGFNVTNDGMQALTSLTATLNVDGTDIATENFTGNLVYGASRTFNFNASFTPTTLGDHAIVVTVSNPNGVADNVDNNEASVSVFVYGPGMKADRISLLEHFTTAQCPNCPDGDQRIHTAISGRNDVIWLSHHAGFYTDDMTVSENNTMLTFFMGGSTYAPAAMLDRSVEFGDGRYAVDPTFFPGSTLTQSFNAAVAVPTFVTVDINNVNYNRDNRTLTATVSGHVATFAGLSNPRVSLYLVEDSIYGTQAGAAGKIYHMHVMRHAISDVWGDAMNADDNGDFSLNFSYALPATYNAKNCKLIAFVSNYNEADRLDRRVMNAKQTGYITTAAAGIDEISDNVEMNVYPNPTTTVLNVAAASEIRDVRIMNVLGQEVYANSNVNAQTLQVNTTAFAAGMYVVTVKTNDGIATRRINVVR